MQDDHPIILSPPSRIAGFQTNNDLSLSTFDSSSLRHASDDFSSLLPFGNLGISGENVGAFEHVFAQILQSDAKRAAAAQDPSSAPHHQHQHHPCECVKSSSVYSVVLELAPHIRRALDALSALPEHQRREGRCEYFGNLQGLDDSTAYVSVSVFSNALVFSADALRLALSHSAIVKAVSSSLTSRSTSGAPSPVEPQSSSSQFAARNFGVGAGFALPFPTGVSHAPDLSRVAAQVPASQLPQSWSTTATAKPPMENNRIDS